MRALFLILALAAGTSAVGQGYWGVGDLFALGGPREMALGGFLSAFSHFPEALHANPALLGFADAASLGSSYSRLFGVLDFYCVEAAGSYWGLGAYSLDSGALTDDLAYTAYGVVFAAGLPLGEYLGLGAMWKGFFQAEPGEAFGWALDPALVIRAQGIVAGVVFENAASAPVEYEGHREPWPWGVRGGLAVVGDLEGMALMAVANVRYGSASRLDYAAGIEIRTDQWCLRLGYGSLGFSFGATVGFGSYRAHWGIRVHPQLPLTIAAGASWEPGR